MNGVEIGKERTYVFLAEDGTAIKREVDYCPNSNQVTGLVAPFSSVTGMPEQNFYPASSPSKIQEYMDAHKSKWSTTMYAMVLITLHPNVPPYIFGLFGTNNQFSNEHCKIR